MIEVMITPFTKLPQMSKEMITSLTELSRWLSITSTMVESVMTNLYLNYGSVLDDWLLPQLWFLFVCLIWFFMSHQQSFSYIGTGLPGLNQY